MTISAGDHGTTIPITRTGEAVPAVPRKKRRWKVKWGRSDEGYVDSKCGRFDIVALYCGTTRPQAYAVYYTDPVTLSRTCIESFADTQSQCKDEADEYLKRNGIKP